MKILMVCLGNICRSPIAELVFKDFARKKGLDWTVRSAGTNRYHKGGPADPRAIAECRSRGLDLSHHIAKRVMPSDFENYDVLFSMAKDVTEELEDFCPEPGLMKKVVAFRSSGADVPDPWYGDHTDFARCFDILVEACEFQLQRLEKKAST